MVLLYKNHILLSVVSNNIANLPEICFLLNTCKISHVLNIHLGSWNFAKGPCYTAVLSAKFQKDLSTSVAIGFCETWVLQTHNQLGNELGKD